MVKHYNNTFNDRTLHRHIHRHTLTLGPSVSQREVEKALHEATDPAVPSSTR
jgi:hypothetical protein